MAGQDGVLQLREDGLLVAEDALDQGLAGQDAGHGVAPDLLLDRAPIPSRTHGADRSLRDETT